ncbi:hypothetical protein V8F20_012511 [Naviculisporaceae sp. PSN 640]
MEALTAGANIGSVPTEILLSILSILSSRDLLPLLAVNRRFYSAVIRILHTRLIKAAPLPNHRLILECYHPSAKLSTPYLYCDHLSTDDLDVGALDPQGQAEGDSQGQDGQQDGLPRPTMADIGQIYAHFRPIVQVENQRARLRYPRRAPSTQPGNNDTGGGGPSQAPQEVDVPTQDIYLDENQLFSQLCTITNLVKLGPKPSLFVSHVNVSDGIIRVWRQWMARQAEAESEGNTNGEILWADTSQNVGVRFRVAERGVRQSDYYRHAMPVLMAADEEPPVAYKLELEELVVRAHHLLLATERSEVQESDISGKALMISAAAT